MPRKHGWLKNRKKSVGVGTGGADSLEEHLCPQSIAEGPTPPETKWLFEAYSWKKPRIMTSRAKVTSLLRRP
jgi:hypothetical protein